jgi:hypothetical protein
MIVRKLKYIKKESDKYQIYPYTVVETWYLFKLPLWRVTTHYPGESIRT